jgi:hypothetical protein
LAERENWEALRRIIAAAAKPQPQQNHPKQPPIQHIPPQPFNKTVTPQPQKANEPIKPVPTPSIEKVQVRELNTQPPAKRVVEEKINRTLSLNERPPPNTIDLAAWKEIFINKFPQITLTEPATRTTQKSTAVAIVYDSVNPQELAFLQNIARTCHLLLGNTRLIQQKEYVPDSQKMVISYGIVLEQAFPLESLSVYLKSPGLKAQLWRQLYSHFTQKSS